MTSARLFWGRVRYCAHEWRLYSRHHTHERVAYVLRLWHASGQAVYIDRDGSVTWLPF